MKNIFRNIFMASLVVAGSAYLASCSKDSEVENIIDEVEDVTTPGTEEEDGYFIATLSSGLYNPITRAAISGESSRVQSLRYIIYKKDQNGKYQYFEDPLNQNDKYLFGESGKIEDGTSVMWPYKPLSVKLSNGDYKFVFLGNMNEKQFVKGETTNDPIVTNYKDTYTDARINLPTVKGFYEKAITEGSSDKESNFFYWDTVEVSTSHPNAEVLLQRIVSKFQMSKETLSSEDMKSARVAILNSITDNLVAYLQTDQVLTNLVGGEIGKITTGVFEALHIDALDKMLLSPIINAVANSLDDTKLLPILTEQIDGILKMNEDKNLLDLNALLNPWGSNAKYAIVSYNKFTKAVSFDNKPVEYYTATEESTPCFAYTMSCQTNDAGPKNYLEIYGLNGDWDLKRIDATDGTHSLIAGQVIDQTVDGWLLPGSLHDADANLKHTFVANKPYNSVYSSIALNVYPVEMSEGQPMDNLKLKLDLGKILDLNQILNGAIEDVSKNQMTNDYEKEMNELKKDPTIGSVVTDLLKGLLGLVGGILDDLLGLLLKYTVGDILEDVVFPALKQLGLGGKQGLINSLINALAPEGGIEIELPLNVTLLKTENLEVSGGWTRVYDGELPEMQ